MEKHKEPETLSDYHRGVLRHLFGNRWYTHVRRANRGLTYAVGAYFTAHTGSRVFGKGSSWASAISKASRNPKASGAKKWAKKQRQEEKIRCLKNSQHRLQ